jgi:SAM-dependent methyltransferase
VSTWTDRAYADPVPYLRHRAELIRSLGPPLEPGDRLVDLACGDGGLADFLPGIEYLGVDGNPRMVEEAASRGRSIVQSDLNEFVPDRPVAATTLFRALYYARDRRAFFRHVAGYTERKLVFDLNPRQYAVEDVVADLRAAGLQQTVLRPFFVPQTRALPRPAAAALVAAERSGPLARLALRHRFTYLVAAWRGAQRRVGANEYETCAPSLRRSPPPKSCGENVGDTVSSTRVGGTART